MTKLKYILIIVASILAGIVIGWFIWSGGTLSINMPDITIKQDSLFIPYTDTLIETNTVIKFDTLKATDSIYIVKLDTIYPFDLETLYNSQKPLKILDGIYISLPFTFETTYYDRTDTILYSFSYPELSPFLSIKHGIDSILYRDRIIYKDYWFDTWYIQVPIYCALFGAGAAINSGGAK